MKSQVTKPTSIDTCSTVVFNNNLCLSYISCLDNTKAAACLCSQVATAARTRLLYEPSFKEVPNEQMERVRAVG